MDEAGPDTPLQRGFFTPRSKRIPATPRPPPADSRRSLPDRHGGRAFAVLGREPTVAFATWDLPADVGEGWRVEIAAEGEGGAPTHFAFPAHAHGAYLEGLQAGGRYRVRAQLVSPEGLSSPLVPAVAELALPPALPVFEAEVRFARVPWAGPSSPSHPAPVTAPLPQLPTRADVTSPGAGSPPRGGMATAQGTAPAASRPFPAAGWTTGPKAS